jgi:2-(1,2-epoxy-1,2-dihydrophenyl)acetyl-CoA isomerase
MTDPGMSGAADVSLERRGPVAILTMSTPGRRNAFTPDSRHKLTDYLNELARSEEVRAIILRGDGEHFCVGANLVPTPGVPVPQRTPMQTRENVKDLYRLVCAIAANPKPVIAAVEGDAFGGGLALAAACDVLVAARTARLGTAFTAIGLMPDLGLLYSLPQRVGVAKARQMLMLSSRVDGTEALALGLADELAEPGQALERALQWAERFNEVAPVGVAIIKESLSRGITSIEDAMRTEVDLMAFVQTTEDRLEGVAAFREKRKPVFKGR